MAKIEVTPRMLTHAAESLGKVVEQFQWAAQNMQQLKPDGLVIERAPAIADALPAIIQFAAQVDAELRTAESEMLFGVSAKTRRRKNNTSDE